MQQHKPQLDVVADAISFADDSQSRPSRRPQGARWKILVVDDDEEVHAATRFVLGRKDILGRSLDLIEAKNSRDAQDELLRHPDIAVILLDVVMEEHDSGLKFAKWIREAGFGNARIILRTGQPGYAPELDVIRDYDINDYRAKSELTQTRLITSMTAALRSFQQIEAIERSRRGLELIVASCSKLFQERELAGFSRGVLMQIASLCDVQGDGLICDLTLDRPGGDARIVSGIGGLAGFIGRNLSDLPADHGLKLPAAESARQGASTVDGPIILALDAPPNRRLVAALDHDAPLDGMDAALLRVFAANIAVGFENVGLIERLDRLAFWDETAQLPNRNQLIKDLKGSAFPGAKLAFVKVITYADTLTAFGQNMANGLMREVAHALGSARVTRSVYSHSADVLATFVTPGGRQAALLSELAQRSFHVGEQIVRGGFAIGTAVIEADVPPEELCEQAYAAMALGEARGQTTPVAFEPSMNEKARDRIQLAAALREALECGDVKIVFQPFVDMTTGACTGVEALARWTLAGQPVSPGVFIPLAEQIGLSLDIFALGIERAANWLKHRPTGASPVYVSVNLSARDLDRADLIPYVMALLGRTQFPPELLQVEITEQSLISDFARSEANLRALRNLGCRIAIDDFGTGYSSLSYVGRLPVNVLKLDRQFVVGLSGDPASQAIAGLTLELARRLGLEILAEGVETAEQQQALQALGYTYAQGYRFGRPMPVADFDGWLAMQKARA